jgi:site-specific DNA-methyltransferase (adenine-specific)
MPISVSVLSDNMRFMEGFPDGFFDLCPDDPPYGLGQNLKKARSRGKLAQTAIKDEFTWDNQIPGADYFNELRRVSKNQIIWGANYFPEICGEPFKAPRRHEYTEFIAQHPIGWIIWDKVNGANDFSDCELAWTSLSVPSQVFYFMWNGMIQGLSLQHGTVMQGNKALNEKRIHPTQKPLPLCQWQLQQFARPGDKIGDFHSGSQSLRIAAYKMGFDYWGCDASEKHHADGCARFEQQINTPMFQL